MATAERNLTFKKAADQQKIDLRYLHFIFDIEVSIYRPKNIIVINIDIFKKNIIGYI